MPLLRTHGEKQPKYGQRCPIFIAVAEISASFKCCWSPVPLSIRILTEAEKQRFLRVYALCKYGLSYSEHIQRHGKANQVATKRRRANCNDWRRKKTRKLCCRKNVREMHNPTIRTWFEARKSIYSKYRLLGCTGNNKAKTAVSVAIEAKPEVEIWRRPKKSKERW